MRSLFFAILLSAMLIAACAPQSPTGGAIMNLTPNKTTPGGAAVLPIPADPVPVPPVPNAPSEKPLGDRYVVERTEGDLVELKPQAIDPDGDKLEYTFTKPFDDAGRWQTKIGDEGKYAVVVGVSDGHSMTTETVDVVIARANRQPIIECKNITVNEGDPIDLHESCTVTDEDNAEVVVTYGGWMSSWRYETTHEDAGAHNVIITASDRRAGETLHTVEKFITINVKDVNRAPVFDDKFPQVITAAENDVITLPIGRVNDPDGDRVSFTFSGPFDRNGVWKTKIGDAGSYSVDVVATDGQMSAKESVKIELTMLNTAPVLKFIPDISVTEGETIKLPVDAFDREGDALTTRIEGWMTGMTYKTSYDDAGSYTVKVIVTDGVFNTSQVVRVTVADINRPPVFVSPA